MQKYLDFHINLISTNIYILFNNLFNNLSNIVFNRFLESVTFAYGISIAFDSLSPARARYEGLLFEFQ